jgi:hypothetical protein
MAIVGVSAGAVLGLLSELVLALGRIVTPFNFE